MVIPWVQIATTAARLGSMAITGRKLAGDIRMFLRDQDEAGLSSLAVAERLQRLEQAAELQLKLNEQYHAQLELMQPLLENSRKSMRMISRIAIVALILSLAALVVAFVKV